MTRDAAATTLWLTAAGLLVLALANGLSPSAFFSGDSGARLVAARQALAHPARPLEIDVPVIGGRAAPDLLGRFFEPHGDHAHALTSPLFPVLSAPALALFGERGLYILPGLSWLLTLWLAARVSRLAEPQASPAWGLAVLVAAAPLLFYALEFWEHAPAVVLTTGATLAALRARDGAGGWLAVGLLSGAAALLRPEALWYGAALALLAGPPSARWLRFGAGVALAQLPLLAYNLLHFGSLFGPHLAVNAAATGHGWLAMRWTVADAWFIDRAGVIVAVLLAGAALSAAGHALRARALTAAGAFVVVGATAWMAIADVRRLLPAQTLWAAFPLAGLALLPLDSAGGDVRNHTGYLRRCALLFVLLAWLSAPHDGGAQWGPRFLLPACVPLALVGGLAARGWIQARRWRWAAWPAFALMVVAGLWVQRSAYRDLRITKLIYTRVVTTLGERAGAARYVLSDLWWLDLVAAHLHPRLTFLCAESEAEATAAVQRLESAGVSPLLIVRSGEEAVAGPTEGWLRGTCYVSAATGTLADRRLTFTSLRCGVR